MPPKTFLVLSLVIVFLSTVQGGDSKESETMQGTWIPTTAELGGQKFPTEVLKTIKLEVKGNNYKVTVGKEIDQGTVKLNLKAKPNEVDISGTKGPNKGKTILAIFERNGDTLQVCYDLSGKARPTEFKTTEATQHFLVTYKRNPD